MSEQLKMSVILPVSPQRVYEAWMDSAAHSDFTGSPAQINSNLGGEYSAWDGYISGKTIVLEPFRHIRQTWRTSEFPANAPDSILDIEIEVEGQGSKLTLIHKEIPEGQSEQYRQGWEDFYFSTMKDYFAQ